jgi:hypothetical protein
VYLAKFLIRFLTLLVATCVGTHSAVLAQTSTQSLELMVLGSGGPGAFGRVASCYLVLIGRTARILVDAGPGAFTRRDLIRWLEEYGIKPAPTRT